MRTFQSIVSRTRNNINNSARDCGEHTQDWGTARGTPLSPHCERGCQRSTWGCMELEESSTVSSVLLLPSTFPPSLFPAEPSHWLKKKKKGVNSLPVLLKPNMSVIDEAVFINFKGERVSEWMWARGVEKSKGTGDTWGDPTIRRSALNPTPAGAMQRHRQCHF